MMTCMSGSVALCETAFAAADPVTNPNTGDYGPRWTLRSVAAAFCPDGLSGLRRVMDRYVTTEAIRSALKGREPDLLLALGIDLRAGSRHVRSPYPHHDDRNPSWRWDTRKGRAYCTCIEGSDARSTF